MLGTTTKGAKAARMEASMEFKDFWQKTPLPWQLEDLTQEQIDAIKKLASKAFTRAYRACSRWVGTFHRWRPSQGPAAGSLSSATPTWTKWATSGLGGRGWMSW